MHGAAVQRCICPHHCRGGYSCADEDSRDDGSGATGPLRLCARLREPCKLGHACMTNVVWQCRCNRASGSHQPAAHALPPACGTRAARLRLLACRPRLQNNAGDRHASGTKCCIAHLESAGRGRCMSFFPCRRSTCLWPCLTRVIQHSIAQSCISCIVRMLSYDAIASALLMPRCMLLWAVCAEVHQRQPAGCS